MPELPGVGRHEGHPVGRLHIERADADHRQHHGHLDHHDHRVHPRRFRNAAHQQQRDHGDDGNGRQVGEPRHRGAIGQHHALERRCHQARRQGKAPVLQQRADIARPAHRDGGRAHRVFQHQVPADDPGHQLAHRGIGVGVGAAGNRDHAGQLAVAHAGQAAADGGDQEAQHHGGPGIVGRGDAGEREQPGADDAADPQRNQAGRAEAALQARLVALARELRHALAREQRSAGGGALIHQPCSPGSIQHDRQRGRARCNRFQLDEPASAWLRQGCDRSICRSGSRPPTGALLF